MPFTFSVPFFLAQWERVCNLRPSEPETSASLGNKAFSPIAITSERAHVRRHETLVVCGFRKFYGKHQRADPEESRQMTAQPIFGGFTADRPPNVFDHKPVHLSIHFGIELTAHAQSAGDGVNDQMRHPFQVLQNRRQPAPSRRAQARGSRL